MALRCVAAAGHVAGHEAVARLLVEKGADVAAQDQGGATPLYWARGRTRGRGTVAKAIEG
jgi:ankyrin repeat protein